MVITGKINIVRTTQDMFISQTKLDKPGIELVAGYEQNNSDPVGRGTGVRLEPIIPF